MIFYLWTYFCSITGQKRFKTLQLRSDSVVTSKAGDQTFQSSPSHQFMEIEGINSKDSHTALLKKPNVGNTIDAVLNKSNLDSGQLSVNVPSLSTTEMKNSTIGSKIKMMKAASFFDSQKDMDIDGGVPPPNVSRY